MSAQHPPRSRFGQALKACQPPVKSRRWVFVPYDQLNERVGPLSRHSSEDVGIVCIETSWKPAQRLYHQQKLALIVANLRHFALEQARRGVAVRYVATDKSYGAALAELSAELGPLQCAEPAERELREDIKDHVKFVPHSGWLTQRADFDALDGPPWRMDVFYRRVRRRTGWLMDGNTPRGGRWSYDTENRKRYTGTPPLPALPVFKPDDITQEVGDLIASRYGHHPGTLDLSMLPTTQADAQAVWRWAKAECLPHFGPFEDAMTRASTNLFHTRLSPLLNLHRLLPGDLVAEAVGLDIDLASLEGFVRQILGWREFMHHVHVATDGLRTLPMQNFLQAEEPVPPAYWGKPSGLRCLDTVVQSVWREGYSHHITRLMVLCNIATLVGVNPRELTDWFWVAYIDAYDWVMETNGMGMGSYALGDVMTTKPYVSGAAYINKMSDYCKACAFSPTKSCPITPMYWAFLQRHAHALGNNHRMQVPLMSLQRRSPEKRQRDGQIYAWVRDSLARGEILEPGNLPS